MPFFYLFSTRLAVTVLYLLLFSLSFSVRHAPGKVPGVLFPYIPAPELIAKAAEEKVRAEMKSEEQVKELQVLQEENDRLRNEIKALQEYKEKAHRELCRVRDEQKTFGKIKVNTEL